MAINRIQNLLAPASRAAHKVLWGFGPAVRERRMRMHRDMMDSCFPLAMAYVPWQMWEALYNEKTALMRGTAFPSLFKPFEGVGV